MDIMEFRRAGNRMYLMSQPSFFSKWFGVGTYCVKREGMDDVIVRSFPKWYKPWQTSRSVATKMVEAKLYPPNGPDGRAPDLEAWRAARGA